MMTPEEIRKKMKKLIMILQKEVDTTDMTPFLIHELITLGKTLEAMEPLEQEEEEPTMEIMCMGPHPCQMSLMRMSWRRKRKKRLTNKYKKF